MENFTMNSALMPSAEEALIAANNMAVASYGPKAKRVHVFVVSIIQVGDKWKAIVRVVLEPKEETGENLDAKNPNSSDQSINFTPRKDQPAIDPLDIVNEYLPWEGDVTPDVHFYMHPKEAGIDNWDTFLPDIYPDYHYHFLESGSSWEIAQRIFPDIDFSLAAELDLQPAVHVDPKGKNFILEEPKLKKNPYIIELTEEF